VSRRRAREFALQALYQSDISGSPGAEAVPGLWSGQVDGGLEAKAADGSEVAFCEEVVAGVDAKREEIDGLIEQASENWRLSRMPVVDRNILRLATYELIGCPEVPASVSINEALELAKRFGDKSSRAFINGILDKIAALTGRGGRSKKRG
jgi:N utilization substance protein B